MGAGLIDDFIRNILSTPFCPYHFVYTILSNTILSVYHFVLEPSWVVGVATHQIFGIGGSQTRIHDSFRFQARLPPLKPKQ